MSQNVKGYLVMAAVVLVTLYVVNRVPQLQAIIAKA